MVATITSAGSYGSALPPPSGIIKVGGYYFAFYMRTSDSYYVYKSSSDGVTWSSEHTASHAAHYSTARVYSFDAYTDGSGNIIIFYVTGVEFTSCTAYTRTGTQSGGVISWDTQVALNTTSGGVFFPYFFKTANRWYLAYSFFDGSVYRVYVLYDTSTPASSWTSILDSTTMIEAGYQGQTILCQHPSYTDGIMLIVGNYGYTYYKYKLYDGSTWAADSTFGFKTGGAYSNYRLDAVYSPATGEIYFIEANFTSNNVRFYYYDGSWHGPTVIAAEAAHVTNLSLHSSNLYAFFRDSTNAKIRYLSMDYATRSWGSVSDFVTGQTSLAEVCVEFPGSGSEIGVMWRNGAASPFDMKFDKITLVVPAKIAPGALNPVLKAINII